MTVTATTNSTRFHGSGSTGPFTWTWRFLDNDDVKVYLINDPDESAPEAEARTLLTEGDDYTLTGAETYGGGSLTLVSALATGTDLLVVRRTGLLQEVSIRNQGDQFFPETHEDVFDKLTMAAQDLSSRVDDMEELSTFENEILTLGRTTIPALSASAENSAEEAAASATAADASADSAAASESAAASSAEAAATSENNAEASASNAATSETNAAASETAAATSASAAADSATASAASAEAAASSTLSSLLDTDIQSPAEGDLLVYNATNGTWEVGTSAPSADKLTNEITLSLSGYVTGSVSFNGSADVEMETECFGRPVDAGENYYSFLPLTSGSVTGTTWALAAQHFLGANYGTLRIQFKMFSSSSGIRVYGRIYRIRNGVASAVGTARNTEHLESELSTFTEDTAGWLPGDIVAIYAKADDSSRISNITDCKIGVSSYLL